MVISWRANDGPLKVVFGSSLPSLTKKEIMIIIKNVVKVGPPLTKLSGSAHVVVDKILNLVFKCFFQIFTLGLFRILETIFTDK